MQPAYIGCDAGSRSMYQGNEDSLPTISLWPGTHSNLTQLCIESSVRAFMVSRTSCEVDLAAAKALSAAWLSEHIAIEAFTSSHKCINTYSIHMCLKNSSIMSKSNQIKSSLFQAQDPSDKTCSMLYSFIHHHHILYLPFTLMFIYDLLTL